MFSFNKNKSLSNTAKSGMPQMATTLNGWEVPLTLIKITQDVVDGDLVTSEQTFKFQGVWQPLRTEVLELKPEGQRSWEWVWIHAKSSQLNLETGDKVRFNNRIYKVERKKDYGLNAFVEYELCRDYESGEIISDEDN